MSALGRYLASLDPRLPRPVWILSLGGLANAIGNGLAFPFLVIYLHNVRGISLGTAGLVLATIGLYAVVASSARQRYREIGVRMALGARASDVRRLVLGEGMKLSVIGTAIGLLISAAGGRALTQMLFEIQPLDVPTLLVAALLLLTVSAIACYLPARRAQRVDAAAMLRGD